MPNIQPSIAFGVSVVQDIIAAGYDFLNNEEPRKDVVREATEQYVKGLFERFGEVKVLGMNRPVPLLSLYVRANILEKISAKAGAKLDELEEFFDFDRRVFGKKVATKDGEEIANNQQRFIVLGKPGAGKTTFLKYLALAMLHKNSIIKNRRLPIFITLRYWADKKCRLIPYITDQFETYGFKQTGPLVENLLKQGKCLVLFDGLDEVSQEVNLDKIISDIRDFTDKYSNNQYVISCRVAAYNYWFERFTDVEMADFNEEQIEGFVRNWFLEEPNIADECIKRLKASPQLNELSSIPLLITLLCISYNANNDFPNNRAELYEEAIGALLRHWDSSRRIRRDSPDPYNQLTIKQKENMFARIAFGTFSENRYFIREQELTKMIGNFIGNLPAFNAENLEVDSSEVLRAIEAQHGIFVERAKYIHSFAHLTFQEYFTAKFIIDNDNSRNKTLEKLVKEHLYDFKWKEVFLLVASMLPDADELLLLMLRRNRELLKTPLLKNLVDFGQNALLPGGNHYSTETRKVIAIYWALARAGALTSSIDQVREFVRFRALDLDLALARAGDLARYLALNNDRAFELALSRDRELVRARANALSINLARTLNLDLDCGANLILDLVNRQSLQFVEKISAFLQANLLISQCLSAAAYLSKSTREYVLSMMLAPLTEEEKATMGIKDEE